MKIEKLPTDKLIPYARNAKRHDATQVSKLAGSIREFGFNNPVLIDKDNGIIAGHGRVMAAQQLGLAEVPCIRLGHLTDNQRKAYILADNRLAEVNSGWDEELLKLEIADIDWADIKGLSVDDFEFGEIEFGEGEKEGEQSEVDAEPQIDKAEELRAKWGVEPGQLWELGDHRLLCGDSTKKEDVERVIGVGVDMFLTDPPYCSGGFQEAGRATGSIGTKRIGEDGKEYTPRIHNDALSSRGYCALMKSVLGVWRPSFAYMFTDWRMWVQLFDVMESSGFGVRSMIVWNKHTPSMGRGWRAQHELVMFGASAKPEFDNHKAIGNVLSCDRTGNPNHPTEKPVEILVKILEVTDFCKTVGDPFSGSGTTIIACEQLGRKARAIEISPAYVAVALQRWADATGKTPRKL
jgi:DNA modification methylase